MKTALLITLLACICVAPALAQDRVELWADRTMSSCSISEPASPAVVEVHVFVTGSVTANAVRFRAPKPDCWVGATWLGDQLEADVLSVGNSQTDWSIAWYGGAGGCTARNTMPIYLGAIIYQISGQSQPCCKVEVLPAGEFAFVDCDYIEHDLEPGKSVVVNPNESCGCQGALTLAVQPSSWGAVKALYR